MEKPLVVCIVGPTASGKTALGVEIAKKLGGEIVSADSMQVYRGMEIATAKPSEKELSAVRHHLIGHVPVGEKYSVAAYKSDADEAIRGIIAKNKLAIVVGGTGLYIDAVINNTCFFEHGATNARRALELSCEQEGVSALYDRLKDIDPSAAGRIHQNDKKRIIRALEIYTQTGETISEQQRRSHETESPYRFLVIGLSAENREYLYSRINLRVDAMLDSGLVREAREFFSGEAGATARQAIGYKELYPYLQGEQSLDEAVERLKMQTRRYAKRQLTWLRRYPFINWLYIDRLSPQELFCRAVELIENSMSGRGGHE